MSTTRRRTRIRVAVAALALLGLVGCGSDDDGASDAATDATTTTAADATTTTVTETMGTVPGSGGDASGGVRDGEGVLRILVSNDDGIGAKGIDALVEALRQLPDTEVTVVAPKENQSGSGGKTTAGGASVESSQTLSGFPGTAVAGFPADAVNYALDSGALPERPHVVMTGINEGANVGPLVDISGTVGAARAGVRHGIPALASSQGLSSNPDYPSGVKYALEWLAEHRAELLAGTAPVTVTSLNIPTCPTGSIRGIVEVPTAADAGGRELVTSNCESTSPAPTDDVDGFSNGYATLSVVPNEPAAK